jgi:hypothetical protein
MCVLRSRGISNLCVSDGRFAFMLRVFSIVQRRISSARRERSMKGYHPVLNMNVGVGPHIRIKTSSSTNEAWTPRFVQVFVSFVKRKTVCWV